MMIFNPPTVILTDGQGLTGSIDSKEHILKMDRFYFVVEIELIDVRYFDRKH